MSKVIDLSSKRGKIYIADIDNYNEIEADLYIYCTTYATDVPQGTIHADQLAPSYELYIQKNTWIDKGVFRDRISDFKDRYMQEITTREDYSNAIERLRELLSKGLDIVLFDDCYLGDYCHLQVLKEYLKEIGFRVFSPLNKMYPLKVKR